VSEVNPFEFEKFDLLIVGSPTYGGKPTQAIQAFLKETPSSAFNCSKAATFDTRLFTKLVGIFGYAADKIATDLKKNGWTLIVPPKGFFVKGKKGPILDGELEHAIDWAKGIVFD
jgi:flavodoxin I